MFVHSVLLYTLCGANVGRYKNSKLCVCVCVCVCGGREERKGGRKGRDGSVLMCVTCLEHLTSAGDRDVETVARFDSH